MEWLTELITTMHWGAVAQIIMIDILLGGDNAVVIALACRNLDPHQRRQGILLGGVRRNRFACGADHLCGIPLGVADA